MSATATRLPRSIRLTTDDEHELKAIAAQRGISFNRLLVDAALGRLPEQVRPIEQRMRDLEERLERLEQLAYSNA